MIENQSSFYLDEIMEVVEVGGRETYDLEIPELHCYYGNGILIHNSADIEGDADSIILLHRDRKSDAQESTPIEEGIFVPELLVRVSKARWGPGGDTHMIMDDERCQVLEGL